jgi:prepilin-type N-terminal cleavage/methylation domain-containing protein/prepilin-type processing-associated H-X9-DG protein
MTRGSNTIHGRNICLRSTRAPSAGFSLIELLVVVAIIAILGSLLLPALSKAKAAAQATECRNNLHTIGLALQMYANERGHYPTVPPAGIMGANPAYGWLMLDTWKEGLVPFIAISSDFARHESAMRTLRCPQLVSNADGVRGNGQYAANGSGTAKLESPANLGIGGGIRDGQFRATRETDVLMPGDMIAAGDIEPGPTMGDLFMTFGYFDICWTNQAFWLGKSHNGQANALICDGHVTSARQTNWLSLSRRSRWNNDHQPHPETWARP